ncbi:MAG: 2-C-methyl-D-erythritol 4-phosphate cytidylyltransferase [Acidimicrobiales bacterium]
MTGTSVGQVWTIVVAAGQGTRFGGDVPKQLLPLGDRRVLDWSLSAASAAGDGVVLVGPPGEAPPVDGDVLDGVPLVVTEGGAERTDSVRAGLAVLPAEVEVVCVHDGARPLASVALFERVVAAVRAGADGAVPGVAVTDTIKRVRADGSVVQTLPRAELRAVQTPQAFTVRALREAHAGGGDATDDAALVEAAGGRVVVVEGDPVNVKLTRPGDLPRLEALLAEHPPVAVE